MTLHIKSITEATPLIPELVAETIPNELAAYYLQLNNKEAVNYFMGSDGKELSRKLAEKAEHHYKNSIVFRAKLEKRSCREYLIMFYRHWSGAILKEMGFEYVKDIDESYFNGQPLIPAV